MKKMIYIVSIIVLTTVLIHAQKQDPYKILQNVNKNFESVKDFEADTFIKVDMDIIKVPDMRAKVYFKQPDKMKLDSKGFAMLPRQAFSFSPAKLTGNNYTAYYLKDEDYKGIKCAVIRIIPKESESEVVTSMVWIDKDRNRFVKVLYQNRNGDSEVEFSYSKDIGYPLPSSIKFTVDSSVLNRRRGTAEKDQTQNSAKSRKGTVLITYDNYKVNKGLPDSIFNK